MMGAVYFFIAILATTMGALTGMGGGIIIKPVLDLLGHFDAETINFLSLVTVFSMAVVSIVKQTVAKNAVIEKRFGLCLVIGSLIGGYAGQVLFQKVLAVYQKTSAVRLIQNIILALVVAAIMIYMKNKAQWRAMGLKSSGAVIAAGCFLGIISSFLGIGGGPLNVAALVFLFALDVKQAALYSILTILFTQLSKLGLVLYTAQVSTLDLAVLPYMVTGAVLGGFIGSHISKQLTEKSLVACFNAVQFLVLGICIVNIARSLNAG